MKTSRWLLPFTHGVDMRAIEYAVRLAENAGATLIPVSLVPAPSRGTRLELIQQSKDFLEAVRYKAERLRVPLESDEVFTTDVQQSLVRLVHEKQCDGIVLVTGNGRTRLLQDLEVKHLLIEPPVPLVIIRETAPGAVATQPNFLAAFFAWLHRFQRQRVIAHPLQEQNDRQDEQEQATGESQWIQTEQPSIG